MTPFTRAASVATALNHRAMAIKATRPGRRNLQVQSRDPICVREDDTAKAEKEVAGKVAARMKRVEIDAKPGP